MPNQGGQSPVNANSFTADKFRCVQDNQDTMPPPTKRLAAEFSRTEERSKSIYPVPNKVESVNLSRKWDTGAYIHTSYSLAMEGNSGSFGYRERIAPQHERSRRKAPKEETKLVPVPQRFDKGSRVAVATSAEGDSCFRNIVIDRKRPLQSIDRNAFLPGFSPNIMQLRIAMPGFSLAGNSNFRRLSGPTLENQGRDMESLRWHIANSLRRHGVCVINRFMGAHLGDIICEEMKTLHSDGIWDSGQSMGGNPVREDLITWLDGTEPRYPTTRALCAKLDSVVGCGTGVTENYTICGSTKAMIARYKGKGAGYKLHVDNPTKDGRCLTCIYYVNKGWDSKTMGGNLKLYAKTSRKTAEIQPIFDRIVFFYSDARNPHEVLPAYEDRSAITVWYFDLTQRAKAIERMSGSRAQFSSTLPSV